MRYLVTSRLNQAPTRSIMALIPAEIARGKELDAQGIRLKLYVAADQTAAWQIYQGNTRGRCAKSDRVTATLPIRRHDHHAAGRRGHV